MYENNQYPNQEPKQTSYGSYGSASYSNYDFGSREANQGPTYGGAVSGNVNKSVSATVNESANQSINPKKKEPSKVGAFFKKALLCATLGLFFGLCAGVGFYAATQAMGEGEQKASADNVITNPVQNGANTEVIETSTSDEAFQETNSQTITMVDTDITSVVKDVMPAMVSIGNEYREEYSYFGQTFSQHAEAAGSGIIVGENDNELLVVTNYHVIEDAERLTVTFIDNTEAEAQLKGTDASMDLAVLAVPLDGLSQETLGQLEIAKMGDSDRLNLGEPVIAIGNALGYGQSVTTGIVSALNREVELDNGMVGTFIQTDAAINPGNSGGALLNLNGEVIGINSNKIGGDVIEGMGYAIPISAAEPIIGELMLKETKLKVSEDEVGYIGIQPATVTADVAEVYGMPQGVYIAQIIPGAPAEAAGLVKGDIITSIDGTTIKSYEDLQEEMQYHAVGSTVEIVIQRNTLEGYQEMTFTVTLGSRTN